jgi:hypothetical protein
MILKLGGPENLEKYIQRVEDRPDVKAAIHNYEAAREAVSVAWVLTGQSSMRSATTTYSDLGFFRM